MPSWTKPDVRSQREIASGHSRCADGFGKTITLAQVIDFTFGGGDGISARPNTVFLWLSDSPELNVQSKNKLLSACDELPFHKMVTIDSDNFDDDYLQPGHVYFINTQLLARTSC